MGVKIAIVGGGSTYTPELVEGIAARATSLPVDELVLLDPDEARLEVVGGLARRILRREGWAGRLVCTSDRPAALDGASFVIVQLRVGGQVARLSDETIPLAFGAIGQETTGAGGLAKALRTVPVLLEIAEDVARRSAPDAWLIDFTNPVGIATQALLDAGHRAIGLCNVAIGFQRRLATHFAVAPDRVALGHVGLNHLSWIRRIDIDGVDRTAEVLANPSVAVDAASFPPEFVRAIGALPSSYLRYYFFTAEVLAAQLAGHRRAEEVARIEQELLARYADPSLERAPDLLASRGGAFYSDAAAALMTSLHGDIGDIQVVDVRNDGAIPGLPADAVVEVPARVDRTGAHPLPVAPLPPEMLGLVQHVKAYERLAVEAAVTRDRGVALRALMANPLVPGYAAASGILDAILRAERERA